MYILLDFCESLYHNCLHSCFCVLTGTEDAEEFLFVEGDHFRTAVKPNISIKANVVGTT